MTVLKLVLHPNTERADIMVHTKVNKERYCFTRDKQPKGREALLIRRLQAIVGIHKVEIGGEKLSLGIQAMTNPKEWLPQAMAVIKKYYGADYNPTVLLDDRREYEDDRTEYDEDGWRSRAGRRIQNADIGVPYEKFSL